MHNPAQVVEYLLCCYSYADNGDKKVLHFLGNSTVNNIYFAFCVTQQLYVAVSVITIQWRVGVGIDNSGIVSSVNPVTQSSF